MAWLFVFGSLLGLVILALLLLPLFRRPPEAVGNRDRQAAIYRDQLNEVSADLARGVLTEAEAKAAKAEIERRLLVVLRQQEEEGPVNPAVTRRYRLLAAALVGLVPLGAGLLYGQLGSPTQPGVPFAERPLPFREVDGTQMTAESLRDRIEDLERAVAQNPGDLMGQILLARSLLRIEAYDRALAAFRRANQLAGGTDPQLASEYAETMVIVADGTVTPEARLIFSRVLEDFPGDARSRYFLALAAAQDGRSEEALAALQSLRADSPEGAGWLPAVDALIGTLTDGPPPAE